MVLPDVGAVTAFFKRGWMGCVGDLSCEGLLRFGAEVRRKGNDAGDVRGAIGIDVAGVGVGRLSGGGSLCGWLLREGRCGSEDQKGGKQVEMEFAGEDHCRRRISESVREKSERPAFQRACFRGFEGKFRGVCLEGPARLLRRKMQEEIRTTR
jgi:hypothetical protein